MLISRRTFAGGALGFTLGGQLAAPGFAQNSDLAAALAAIRRFGEVHLDHYGVPGLTLGVTMPNGIATVFNFGFSDRQARTPIGPDTLFQIGSISKLINAAILHQLAAEGQVRLSDRVSDLLPAVPLPAGIRFRSSTSSTMFPDCRVTPPFRRTEACGRPTPRENTGIIPIPAMRFSGG